MKNQLISSVLIVIGFWYVIGLFVAGVNVLSIPRLVGEAALVAAMGSVAGIIGFALYERVEAGARAHSLLGNTVRGASLTIGDFPVAILSWQRESADGLFLDCHAQWLAEYKSRHSLHFACLMAVAETMCAKRDLPAAAIKGGHGGMNLAAHAVIVMIEAIALTRTWEFEGQKNKKGAIVVPLADAAFKFERCRQNPVIPLAAFAHDLGKIEIYDITEDGVVQKVDVDGSPLPHDDMGARMLRTFPELWALPRRDRDTLLLAVGYHHHTGSLPTSPWIDDEMRAICELVTAADIAAGRKEGRGEVQMECAVEVLEPPLPIISDELFPEPADQGLASADPAEVVTSVAPRQPPLPSGNAIAPCRDEPISMDEDFDMFLRLVLEPGRINGAQRDKRIGFKHRPWVYVSDVHMRKAVSIAFNRPDVLTQPVRGHIHPFTHALLATLKARGALMDTWKGNTYSDKRAMFKTISSGKGGKGLMETPFTIIFASKTIAALDKLADCPHPPEIAGPAWGEQSAINKNMPRIESAAGTAANAASAVLAVAGATEMMDIPLLEPDNVVDGDDASTGGIPELEVELTDEPTSGAADDVSLDVVAADLKAMVAFGVPPEDSLPFIERKIDGKRMALFGRDLLCREYPDVNWDATNAGTPLPDQLRWVEYDGAQCLGVLI